MALTTKQKAFVERYIGNGYNILEAYHFAFKNTNPNPSYPYRLLKDPEVLEAINMRKQEIYDSLAIDAMRVNGEIATIAFANVDEKNTTANKLKALELLSKNLSLQTQKVESKEVVEVCLIED
jgi:phage terminase small subunit